MATENDKIFILQSDVELLSQSHRWGSEPTLEAGAEASVSESVKELMAVPKLELQGVDIDTLTFSTDLKVLSFVLAAILTLLFAVLVNVMMHFKLKKISMVESLKSIE